MEPQSCQASCRPSAGMPGPWMKSFLAVEALTRLDDFKARGLRETTAPRSERCFRSSVVYSLGLLGFRQVDM